MENTTVESTVELVLFNGFINDVTMKENECIFSKFVDDVKLQESSKSARKQGCDSETWVHIYYMHV